MTDQGVGLLSHAVLTGIGLRNARKLPNCGTLAWEMFIGLAGAGDVGIAATVLISDHEYVWEDRVARWVRVDPAAPPADPVNLASAMRAMALMQPEG